MSVNWEFPGAPVVRTQCFDCRGPGSILCCGTNKIPQAAPHTQKKQKKEKSQRIKCCNEKMCGDQMNKMRDL